VSNTHTHTHTHTPGVSLEDKTAWPSPCPSCPLLQPPPPTCRNAICVTRGFPHKGMGGMKVGWVPL
jgi:hypothetical protein